MKKLFTLLLLLLCNFSQGQKSYYGYQSRNNEIKNCTCEDASKEVSRKGIYLSGSYYVYSSDAIERTVFYKFDNAIFLMVYFKSNTVKGYLYGSWNYSYDLFKTLQDSWDKAESKGKFFWENIEKYKIDCDDFCNTYIK